MPKLTIDNQEVSSPPGATILDAARQLGIDIPALCYRDGCRAETSCMVCVVRIVGRNSLAPSCATIVEEGMIVESRSDAILGVRRTALELLLSDHLGDCVAPCQIACPAGMNIPQMIRFLAAGRWAEAIETVKTHIALPAVLGRICHRPCERTCRRAFGDGAVAICLLKRYAADVDLGSEAPYRPALAEDSGKNVAIVGAGPAGLAAAYYLRRMGHGCTIFDDHDQPGGMLARGVDPETLPADVLAAEVDAIGRLGVEFRLNTRVGKELSLDGLMDTGDAVLLAPGALDEQAAGTLGVEPGSGGLAVKRGTFETSRKGLFAAGDVIQQRKRAVRAVADGREAAVAIDQYLRDQPVEGEARPFSTHIGRPLDGEFERFLAGASEAAQTAAAGGEATGFSDEEARAEARRCLHCDCRKPDGCKLRDWSAALGARPSRYRGPRRMFEQSQPDGAVIYEPGKCISCGLCVQIAAESREKLGLTFIGRGFDVRVAVPFGGALSEGLTHAAVRCAEACPTGALVMRDPL